jgi:hypothetical protein
MPSAVTTLYPCKHEFGQIKKLLFFRRDGFSFTSVASALISTNWTAKLISTGAAKVVVTPFVVGKITPGEPRESGGGNEGVDGIPTEVVGNHPSVGEFKIFQWDQDVITTIKGWGCENTDVIFINENGAFGYSDGGTTAFKGFPVGGFSISDLEFGDFDGADFNKVKFYLRSNWSDTFEISTATTFALTLVNT